MKLSQSIFTILFSLTTLAPLAYSAPMTVFSQVAQALDSETSSKRDWSLDENIVAQPAARAIVSGTICAAAFSLWVATQGPVGYADLAVTSAVAFTGAGLAFLDVNHRVNTGKDIPGEYLEAARDLFSQLDSLREKLSVQYGNIMYWERVYSYPPTHEPILDAFVKELLGLEARRRGLFLQTPAAYATFARAMANMPELDLMYGRLENLRRSSQLGHWTRVHERVVNTAVLGYKKYVRNPFFRPSSYEIAVLIAQEFFADLHHKTEAVDTAE